MAIGCIKKKSIFNKVNIEKKLFLANELNSFLPTQQISSISKMNKDAFSKCEMSSKLNMEKFREGFI